MLLTCLGFQIADVGVRLDDYGFLAWGMSHRGQPLEGFRGPEWLTFRRPLFTFAWWAAAQIGPDGMAARGALSAIWALTVGLLATVAARRRGVMAALVALIGLMGSQVYVDLLGWWSWLSTAGTLLGLCGGVLALTAARPSALGVVLCGGLALGFKETGGFALGVLALLHGPMRVRAAGATLLLAVAASASTSAHKLALAAIPERAEYHLESLGLFAFTVPLLLASRWPRLGAPWLVGAAALAMVLPASLAGLAWLGIVVATLWSAWPWVVAALASFGPPLLGHTWSRQYLLEGWFLLVACMALVRPLPARSLALGLMGILAVHQAVQFHPGRVREWAEAAEQRQFYETFDPAPAAVLYHPDPLYSFDLDMLVWLWRGAEWRGLPPVGSRPVSVGPRSGVWADVVEEPGGGDAGTRPRTTAPPQD